MQLQSVYTPSSPGDADCQRQVRLKHLESEETEIVHAKFVVGCDGPFSSTRSPHI